MAVEAMPLPVRKEGLPPPLLDLRPFLLPGPVLDVSFLLLFPAADTEELLVISGVLVLMASSSSELGASRNRGRALLLPYIPNKRQFH